MIVLLPPGLGVFFQHMETNCNFLLGTGLSQKLQGLAKNPLVIFQMPLIELFPLGGGKIELLFFCCPEPLAR